LINRIDQTYLGYDDDEFNKFLKESSRHNFRSLCVRPDRLFKTISYLTDTYSPIEKITVVIGFPSKKVLTIDDLGKHFDEVRYELIDVRKVLNHTKYFFDQFFIDFDYVPNMAKIKNNREAFIEELESVSFIPDVVRVGSRTKIIVESGFLDNEELAFAGNEIEAAGFDYIKSSTGFYEIGYEAEKFKEFAKNKPDGLKIKASGGIRTIEDVRVALNSGADVVGTSRGVEIAKFLNRELEKK